MRTYSRHLCLYAATAALRLPAAAAPPSLAGASELRYVPPRPAHVVVVIDITGAGKWSPHTINGGKERGRPSGLVKHWIHLKTRYGRVTAGTVGDRIRDPHYHGPYYFSTQVRSPRRLPVVFCLILDPKWSPGGSASVMGKDCYFVRSRTDPRKWCLHIPGGYHGVAFAVQTGPLEPDMWKPKIQPSANAAEHPK